MYFQVKNTLKKYHVPQYQTHIKPRKAKDNIFFLILYMI
jgi:hypothetical protein